MFSLLYSYSTLLLLTPHFAPNSAYDINTVVTLNNNDQKKEEKELKGVGGEGEEDAFITVSVFLDGCVPLKTQT